jgi:hypothetical protein
MTVSAAFEPVRPANWAALIQWPLSGSRFISTSAMVEDPEWLFLAGCCGTPLAGLEEPKLDDGFPAPRLAGSMRARCFPET